MNYDILNDDDDDDIINKDVEIYITYIVEPFALNYMVLKVDKPCDEWYISTTNIDNEKFNNLKNNIVTLELKNAKIKNIFSQHTSRVPQHEIINQNEVIINMSETFHNKFFDFLSIQINTNVGLVDINIRNLNTFN